MKRKNDSIKSKFTALENHFLNTYFSGLYLSQRDLIAIGQRIGIEMNMNSRELLIKELLNESDTKGKLDACIEAIAAVIDERIGEYHKLSLNYPNARDAMATLAQKANATKALLARERRSVPYA